MENIIVSMETTLRRRAPDLERHLGYWLRRVSNHVSGAFAKALQARHTSVAEWVVLCRVQERPGITPGELAEALALTRGAVSKIIDKLEAKNWIARSAKPEDSRVQLLSAHARAAVYFPNWRRSRTRTTSSSSMASRPANALRCGACWSNWPSFTRSGTCRSSNPTKEHHL